MSRNSVRKSMVRQGVLAVIVGAVIGLPVALASADPADSDTSHPETYVKDSVITAKIKSKLAAKHLATLTDIKVDTDDRGVVWLSGRAPTKDASDLAAMIAKDTEGVTSVHNKISVAD